MKAAILGYGKSGKTAEKLLKMTGYSSVDIYDDNIGGCKKIDQFEDTGYDLIAVSPGIDLRKVRIDRSKLTSELELAYLFIKDKNTWCHRHQWEIHHYISYKPDSK